MMIYNVHKGEEFYDMAIMEFFDYTTAPAITVVEPEIEDKWDDIFSRVKNLKENKNQFPIVLLVNSKVGDKSFFGDDGILFNKVIILPPSLLDFEYHTGGNEHDTESDKLCAVPLNNFFFPIFKTYTDFKSAYIAYLIIDEMFPLYSAQIEFAYRISKLYEEWYIINKENTDTFESELELLNTHVRNKYEEHSLNLINLHKGEII